MPFKANSQTKLDIQSLIRKAAVLFEDKTKARLIHRLNSFYIVGSFAFGKISLDRPDINFLLIFKTAPTPQDYLVIGKICRQLEEAFSQEATIKIEFRPFRYIKPVYKHSFEISINPIITSLPEINAMNGVVFNKWFTQGLKSANKLLLGQDFLGSLAVAPITAQDLKDKAMLDLIFFSTPLSRAPAQYSQEDSNLLLNESLVNAKNIIYLGIEVAMSDQELADKKYLGYIKNKPKMIDFYQERYTPAAAQMVKKVLEVRSNYLQFKNNPAAAKQIFEIALAMADIVRNKLFSRP
ncbi:MAG: hypothetical protein GXP43_00810 [bacterium]|nr:hypothetical protein [bacterium]